MINYDMVSTDAALANLNPQEVVYLLNVLRISEVSFADGFLGSTTFEKLYDFYLNSQQMPYGVAKARTECPDVWIINRLSA